MTTSKPKCRAKGGPAACKDPNCPERQFFLTQTLNSVPSEIGVVDLGSRSTPKPFFGSWTNKDTVLFKTIHGSKLYGMDHAGSDEDYYIVTPTRKTSRQVNAKQKIVDGIDTMAVDFASFVRMAQKGSPQALETMFSRKSKSDFFEDYRTNYYASDPEVIHTYMRTIKNFSYSDTFKLRRHALRLSLNLTELLHTGRFNPTLSPEDVLKISRAAESQGKDYFSSLKKTCPLEVDWDIEDQTY